MYKAIIHIVLLFMIGFCNEACAEGSIASGTDIRLRAGFEHWYSDSFRTADPGNIFSFGMDYRLPVRWIDFLVRYEWAAIKADPVQADYPEFDGKTIHFITAGVSIIRDFHVASQTVTLSAMPVGLLWVKVNGHNESIGQSLGYCVDWLFDGRTGMFLDTRYQHFRLERLDGSHTDKQSNVSIVVGVVTRFR